MEHEIIVGLDIGTTKIAAIVGKRNDTGKIEILGLGNTESLGVRRGVISNIDQTVHSIEQALKEAGQQSQIDIKTVNVGIAGQHIRSMTRQGNMIRRDPQVEITAEEIDLLTQSMYNIQMAPGDEIISVIPQKYKIDNESGITDPRGQLGHQVEANFHVISGQRSAALNIKKCVEKAGYHVDNIILEPLASAESVLTDDELEAGVALVDIGGGTTDIAVYYDRTIYHTAVIPYGGDVITEDIKTGCSILKKHAESLKLKFGSAVASENRKEEVVTIPGLSGRSPKEITLYNLASIIQARMEEIIEMVYHEIRQTNLEKRLTGGIVLTGGGALLKHIKQLTEFKTGLETRIGFPDANLASSSMKEVASPMYSTGIGLVMIGSNRMDESKIKLDPTDAKTRLPKEKGTGKGFGKIKDLIVNFLGEDIK